MTKFVDECRREWKRLNVPDAVANEMAAELEADLREAEADGLSPEEVLGDGVFDARSFAVAWASERGVIPPSAAPSPRRRYGTVVAAVLGALAIVALFLGIAVLTGQQTTEVSVASPLKPPPAVVVPRLLKPGPGAHKIVRAGIDVHPVGWTLLVVGIVGIAAALLVWRRFPLRA